MTAAAAAVVAERTGRPLDHIVFYYAFGLYKTAVVAQQIYWRWKQGLTKDPLLAADELGDGGQHRLAPEHPLELAEEDHRPGPVDVAVPVEQRRVLLVGHRVEGGAAGERLPGPRGRQPVLRRQLFLRPSPGRAPATSGRPPDGFPGSSRARKQRTRQRRVIVVLRI